MDHLSVWLNFLDLEKSSGKYDKTNNCNGIKYNAILSKAVELGEIKSPKNKINEA